MPIKGSWNTLKSFFLTQVHLFEKDEWRNTFANGSLWYVQYFFGQEISEEQWDNSYIVTKSEMAGNASWVPTSVKTAAYFVSALIWIIPGTFARLWSLDSKEVTSAIFADRITLPLPKARDIPRPVPSASPKQSPQPLSQTTGRPATPLSSSEAPKLKTIEAAAPPPASLEASLKKELAPVEAPHVAVKTENYAPLVEEVQKATQFFEELNQRTSIPNKLKRWLNGERAKSNYLQPFYFSRHLKWVVDRNSKRFEGLIPPETLSKWQDEYKKSSEKLKRLGLQAYLDGPDIDNQKPQKNLNDDLQEGINSYKPLFLPTCNPAEWLQTNSIAPVLFMTRYWQCGHEFGISYDAGKLTVLNRFYSKCKTLLRERNLEAYLQEKPKTISPGFYALVCYLTDHPIQDLKSSTPVNLPPAPAAKAPPTPKEPPMPDISDLKLKNCLILGVPLIADVPGMKAVFENALLFQQNKAKFLKYINNYWETQSWILKSFIELPDKTLEDRLNILDWLFQLSLNINGYHVQSALLAEEYLPAIENARTILDNSIYETWKNRYQEGQRKVKKLHINQLIGYGKINHANKGKIDQLLYGKIDNKDLKKNKQILTQNQLELIIPFFKDFTNPALNNPREWLQQKANEEEYCFPFFYSFDLSFRLDQYSKALPKLIAEWKSLYEQAKLKIESLGLTQYFNEMPPTYLDDLIQAFDIKRAEKLKSMAEEELLADQFNTLSKGITLTKNNASPKPLTAENWKTLFENPEKVPNRATRLVQEATEFFKELSKFKDPKKLQRRLEQHRSLNKSYPLYFVRFVVALPALTLKYEKLCTLDKMQHLRTLHFSACHQLLNLGLIEFLEENPFPGQEREPFTEGDIASFNNILKPINNLFDNFLQQSETNASSWLEREISNHPATFHSFYNRFPGICHMAKFLDQKEIVRLKELFPQYLTKLKKLGLSEEHYHTLSCQSNTPAT